MKKLLILFLIFLFFDCTSEFETPVDEPTSVEEIKIALNEFITNQIITKQEGESIGDEVVSFMLSHNWELTDFDQLPPDVQTEYNARVDCDFSIWVFWAGDCLVSVGEYGEGCGSFSGCISNSFHCDGHKLSEDVFYC